MVEAAHPLSLRRQPPVHSPISWRAVGAAWGTVLGLRRADAAPQLETALCDRFSADRALLTDSGTSALAFALRGVLAGDSSGAVALPAYGCYDIATAADAAGVRVVLYDLDPATLSPVWESFDRALDAGARAAVVAHLFGYPVDMAIAADRCARTGAVLIEDAAQGAGGRIGDRLLGSLAPLSVLSFGRGKGVTGGGGGALLARGNGAAVVERSRAVLRRTARSLGPAFGLTMQRLLGTPWLYGIPASLPWLRLGETLYQPVRPPARIAGASAAAAHIALRGADEAAMARRERAHRLERAAGGSRRAVQPLLQAAPGYLRLAVVCAPGENATQLAAVAARLGVARGYPRSLADLPGFGSRVAPASGGLDGARLLADRLVTLPTHRLLSDADLDALGAWMAGV